MMPSSSGPRVAATCLALLLGSVDTATAQAWLPARGEGSVSAAYQNYSYDGHFDPQGNPDEFGATRAHTVFAEIDYGLGHRFAVGASLPFVTSKFVGVPPPIFTPGPLDDGTYNGAFQDWRFGVRYLAFSKASFSLTPSVSVSIPSHDYETVGEAVPGDNRKALILGLSAGSFLDPMFPNAYVHARYAFSLVERERGFPQDRSNVDLELGGTIGARLTVRGLVALQIAHNGPTVADFLSDPDFLRQHDRFVNASYVDVGGGATYALSRAFDAFAFYTQTLSGENAHRAHALSIGTTWRFGGRLPSLLGRP